MKNLSGVTDNKDIVTKELLDGKQNTLVSGTNIKTINNGSLLGSGNISLPSNLVNGSAIDSVRGTGTAVENSNYTIGTYAFSEGYNTKANGTYGAHAEGDSSIASGGSSHAEGYNTVAYGYSSHVEGSNTTTTGDASHAEGNYTTASGDYSHAQNNYTIAQRKSQTALGEYNIADTTGTTSTRGDYAVIVGNGTADNARSNALTVDWSGNVSMGTQLSNGSYTYTLPSATGTLGLTSDITVTDVKAAGSSVVNSSSKTASIPKAGNSFGVVTIGTSTDSGYDRIKIEGSSSFYAANAHVATTTTKGLMSAADKVKLNGLEDEVFIAEKDETTYTEISDALQAGKIVFCNDSTNATCYPYVGSNTTSPQSHVFERVYGTVPNVGRLVVDENDTWTLTTMATHASACGQVTNLGSISASSYKDATITHNLGSIPIVVATLYSSGTAANIGNTTCTVFDVTTTQAKIRVFNNRTSTLSPYINWIAMKQS